MKQSPFSRKVNEQAREVIANILLFDIADPRLSLVTITGCEVSYDRSVCNVFYSTALDNYDDAAEAFTRASGRIRSLMARELSWRVAPELRFILDTSVDEAQRIATALKLDAARFAGDTPKEEAAEPASGQAEELAEGQVAGQAAGPAGEQAIEPACED